MSKLQYSDDIDIPVNKRAPEEIAGYDRDSDGLADLEKRTWGEDGYTGDNSTPSDAVREAENTSDGWTQPQDSGYTNNYTGGKGINPSPRKLINVAKKGGPAGAIIGFLLGMASLVSFFGGPGLLIVHIAEIVNEKFNYQLTSMDVRSKKILNSKILAAKVDNTTTGVCKKVTIRCKFATFSDKEIERFKNAGIEMEKDGKGFSGRHKVKSMTFEGNKVSPGEFARKMQRDPKFNTAVKTGFNPKYAGLHDPVSLKELARVKISRANPFKDAKDDDAREKKVKEVTNGEGKDGGKISNEVDCSKSKNKEACEKNKKEQEGKAKKAGDETQDLVDKSKKSDSTLASGMLEQVGVNSVGKRLLTAGINSVKITGFLDTACSVYGSIKMTSYLAKTLRSAQVKRFAGIILTMHSIIKSGDAEPDDVSYIGTMLTTTVENKDKKITKSATDSFGYRYAAFNDKGIDEMASESVAGINLASSLSGAVTGVIDKLGGRQKADATCKLLGNPFVQVGSFVLGGIVALFTGGASLSLGAVGQGALGVATNVLAMLLPAMIADMIAGNMFGKNTFGERAGNMFVSGSGGIHSSIALKGANAPLTKKQAVAYMEDSRIIAKEYADYDRATLSPFDASNPNTFMGSIYSQLVPVIGSGSSASVKAVQLPLKIFGATFANLMPAAKATQVDNYDECKDPDYSDLGKGQGIAADPYCNPVAGMPTQYLNEEPNDLNQRLMDSKDIDETSGEPKSEGYKKFVKNCIERDDPFGTSEKDDATAEERGVDCIINDSKTAQNTRPSLDDVIFGRAAAANGLAAAEQKKVDYYVHYMDVRISNVMENGYTEVLEGGGGGGGGGSEDGGSGDSQPGTPANTKPSKKGWTLKENTDYSNIACPGGGGEVVEHPIAKFKIRVCPDIEGISKVASINAANITNMMKAAKQAGHNFTGSSFRTFEEQKQLRITNHCPDPINSPSRDCRPHTAKPGESSHERGLAIDFRNCNTQSTACYKWLAENAQKYGMYNYEPEPWHWSTSGG